MPTSVWVRKATKAELYTKSTLKFNWFQVKVNELVSNSCVLELLGLLFDNMDIFDWVGNKSE